MPQRPRAPIYIEPKTTKSGDQSRFDTVRLYPPRGSDPDIIQSYITSSGPLSRSRAVWIVGKGTLSVQSGGQYPGQSGYLTVLPARRGAELGTGRTLKSITDGLAQFSDLEYIEINRRIR